MLACAVLVRRSPFILERPAGRAARGALADLRLVRARALNEYLGHDQFTTSHVLFHAQRPGFAALDRTRARVLSEILDGLAPAKYAARHHRMLASLEKLGWLAPSARDLDRIVERGLREFHALQNRRELREFATLVAQRRPRVVVEIGTARGGLFFVLSQLAHPRATLVSIDVPFGPFGGGQSDQECELFASFGARSQRVVFLRDRSFNLGTRQDLERIVHGRRIDLLFIDGDHSYAAVRWDFEAYGSLVKPGGLIALHDACLDPHNATRGFDVAAFFRTLRRRNPTELIADSRAPRRIRLPLLSSLEHRMGIGLVHVRKRARKSGSRARKSSFEPP